MEAALLEVESRNRVTQDRAHACTRELLPRGDDREREREKGGGESPLYSNYRRVIRGEGGVTLCGSRVHEGRPGGGPL